MRQAVRPIDDAAGALDGLAECLVISFARDRATRRFLLVTDHPARDADADRCFAAFAFDGVRDYRRMEGDIGERRPNPDSYATGASAPIVIQSIESAAGADGRMLALWFGPNFGGLSFVYDGVVGVLRQTRAESRGTSWIYRDLVSGAAIDFAQPFRGIAEVEL